MPVPAPRAVKKRTAQNDLVQRVSAWPQLWSSRMGQVGAPWSSPALSPTKAMCWDPNSHSPASPGEKSRRQEGEASLTQTELCRSFNFPQTPCPNSLAPSSNIWVAQRQGLLPVTPLELGCRGGNMSPCSSQTCPSQLSLCTSHPSCELGDGRPPSNSQMTLTKMLS